MIWHKLETCASKGENVMAQVGNLRQQRVYDMAQVENLRQQGKMN